ncbi:hypothetical protein CEXT_717991 [Caerostris extrusa]|uniref:Uncharacterized protein n=1 Tax=Caerostris extrusa TaxID=172846 RepID=A0AAV4VI25_CAEEX|nr:hypothetical protein CEXT_717991 [Caerostris extrusa]
MQLTLKVRFLPAYQPPLWYVSWFPLVKNVNLLRGDSSLLSNQQLMVQYRMFTGYQGKTVPSSWLAQGGGPVSRSGPASRFLGLTGGTGCTLLTAVVQRRALTVKSCKSIPVMVT